MSAPSAIPDPFGLTADTAGYVPRDATETALRALVETLREGRRPAALVGPPGLGKTLLLHLVARRLDDRLRSVYLPYAALPLDELCAWALSLLGFSQSDDTVGDLMQTASNLLARGSGLLLLIDDASAMPLPTARKLGDLVAASSGALRLLVAAAEAPSTSRMLAATGANIQLVRLVDAMREDETQRYVEARLDRARVPAAVAARFDAATLQSVHRLSAGIPRRVHSVASAVLRGGEPLADPLEEAALLHEERDALAPEANPVAPEPAREEFPTLAVLRARAAPRAEARIEAPPSARAVFATALAVALLAVSLPWLRSALAPPAASVAAAPAPEPPPVPAPIEAGDAAREATQNAVAPPEPPAPAAPAAAAGPFAVHVNARPWANIEVDGLDLGATPIAGIPLLAGPHRFRARMPDGRTLERVVEVSAENRFVVFE